MFMSIATWALLACAAASAQARGPTFEVASVKPVKPDQARARQSPRGGPGTDRPTRFECRGCSLELLIAKAYNVEFNQISGPGWISGDLFEISATLPEKTTVEAFRRMLQSLLTERFRLKVRWETRETSSFELSVGPGGLKLKEAGPKVEPPESGPPQNALDREGFPILLPGQTMAMAMGRYRRHTQETIADLTRFLGLWFGKPVVDHTGLTSKYDITLSFVRTNDPDAPSGPSLEDAVRQTGLRLVSKKVPVEYLHVESAQRVPTDN